MKMGSDKRYTFKCGRWFSKSEDDKQIIREIPAEGQISRNHSHVRPAITRYFTFANNDNIIYMSTDDV